MRDAPDWIHVTGKPAVIAERGIDAASPYQNRNWRELFRRSYVVVP